MSYGLARNGRVWHMLYEDEDKPALCGIGALRRQPWFSIADTLADRQVVCANCTRVDQAGNRRDVEAVDA